MSRRAFPLLAICFYVVTIAYPIVRLRSWYETHHWLEVALINLLTVTLVALPFGFMVTRFVFRWQLFSRRLPAVYTVIGICFLTFPVVVAFELIRLVPGFPSDYLLHLAFATIAVVSAFSLWRGSQLHVNQITIDSNGLLAGKTLIQLSDVHIGSRSSSYLQKIMRHVENLKPTWLVITGDLIDSHRLSKDDLVSLANYSGSKLMVMGNHERYEGLDYVTQLLSNTGTTLIRNEQHLDGPVQFIGVDDHDSSDFLIQQLKRFQVDPNRYRILLYHRPHGEKVASDWGFNLMLVGHTHRGQIFPFIAVVKRFFRLTHGTHEIGDMTLHISMGTGTWGPLLRLGSRNEITHIQFT